MAELNCQCVRPDRLLFEGLEASTEYVVIVFGISSEGEQTTEAATATFSTTAA